VSTDVSLHICANATRRAKSTDKLGFQRSRIYSSSLSSLLVDGGCAPCIDVIVSRKYELQFMDKSLSGRIFRNQKEENAAQRVYQTNYDKLRDSLLEKHVKADKIHIEPSVLDTSSVDYLFYCYSHAKDETEYMASLTLYDSQRLQMFIETWNMTQQMDVMEKVSIEMEVGMIDLD